ncbi:DUF159-domain-containing protein [Sporormia fimetaria CBS 119925]|uniref:DUF159-domain-containing protein n=1 Tax=Sporormia fimetaria CBS 119925 TaxID=1340428 RepID=A0A6A6V600_9PLEO|nr:DUF159-domain-containing protein [Sporormia fimetaria CBS 119925]
MCGRYALALRPSEVRRQLEQSHMRVDHAPDDDDDSIRQTYNFAPSYNGLVYRACGCVVAGDTKEEEVKREATPSTETESKYELQAMKWGLIPSWEKRPSPSSYTNTINCRDDSLIEDRGMWTNMKKTKRCIVVAQGFYEWLKKDDGKRRIPHFTKRKDGQLMCFAGLWDCVQYEGSQETIYTYTIITTDSNKQLNFLHDRMPVILENGSEAIRTWLDPTRTEWSKELQALLKPYTGELECYPVRAEVGKVGNNSPSFIVPVDSAANKHNIANFFGKQAHTAKAECDGEDSKKGHDATETEIEQDDGEQRATTTQIEGSEDNAPLPVPAAEPSVPSKAQGAGVKRAHSDDEEGDTADGGRLKRDAGPMQSPAKTRRKMHSATSNTTKGSPAKAKGNGNGNGSRKITSFFEKR